MLPAIVSLFVAGGLALIVVGLMQSRSVSADPALYLRSLDQQVDAADEFDDRLTEPFLPRVFRPIVDKVFETVGRATPVAQRDRVRHQLVLAGVDARIKAEDFLTLQLVSVLGGALLAVIYVAAGPGSVKTRAIAALLLAGAGILAPRSWLQRKVDERAQQIFLDLPDILDLLAISVEAGVGFEGALEIVCKQFNSPLALEFSRTLKEMELGLPRREALQNLKHRTEVPELSNFVLALTQADALGMPIGRVLHTQAGEMRLKRRQWAREKAGKLPVKILFPLVLCIFPAVMVVVIGPAAATIGKSFR